MDKGVYYFKGRDVLLDACDCPPAADAELDAAAVAQHVDVVSGFRAVELPRDFVAPEGLAFKPLRSYFVVAQGADAGAVAGTCPAAAGACLAASGTCLAVGERSDSAVVECADSPAVVCADSPAVMAARLKGLVNWRMALKFCPSCGSRLELKSDENAQVCPSCGKVHYPRIEPCVIAVIEKGDEILLLRHRQRNSDIWCCLAGFVESGESLEHALIREVKEETGLSIKNIRYAGSQSWPFPDQLMCGFYAEYAGGELKLQEDEIMEARWFRRDALPAHPSPGSISWNLIHYEKVTY